MQKNEVQGQVRVIADQLRAYGVRPVFGPTRAGWARAVWNHIQSTRPDLAEHMHSHYRSDPYQVLKGWMPCWAEGRA